MRTRTTWPSSWTSAAELATNTSVYKVSVRMAALDHSIAPGRRLRSTSDGEQRAAALLRPRLRRRHCLPAAGVFVANFHVGSADGTRARTGQRCLSGAPSASCAAPVRYQGNRVFVAGAGVVEADAVAAAERLGWPFDPRSRLRRLERVS